jgi:hypothetical protein
MYHASTQNVYIKHVIEILNTAHRVRLNKTRAISKAGSVSLFRRNSKTEEPNLVRPLGRPSLKFLTLSCHFFSGLLNIYIPHQNSLSISYSIILHRIKCPAHYHPTILGDQYKLRSFFVCNILSRAHAPISSTATKKYLTQKRLRLQTICIEVLSAE